MKIYVASSWKNKYQPKVVCQLRSWGHQVYDFRKPDKDMTGFNWEQIDDDWENWTTDGYLEALAHPKAKAGFKSDWDAMNWADVFILVMPCGNSAHLEAGWAVGKNKPTVILLCEFDKADLMYKMASHIVKSMDELRDWLNLQND